MKESEKLYLILIVLNFVFHENWQTMTFLFTKINNGYTHHMWAFFEFLAQIVEYRKSAKFARGYSGLYGIIIEMYGQHHPYIGSTIVVKTSACLSDMTFHFFSIIDEIYIISCYIVQHQHHQYNHQILCVIHHNVLSIGQLSN